MKNDVPWIAIAVIGLLAWAACPRLGFRKLLRGLRAAWR